MAAALSPAILLLCHESAPARWSGTLSASAALAGSDLVLRFALAGDLDRLRLPPFDSVRRSDRLWEHSCFEAFVAAERGDGYLEFNFSPSGAWAAYRFAAYREGMSPAVDVAPRVAVRRTRAAVEVAAQASLDEALVRGGQLRLGLCAVIEDAAGSLSYWALRHPPGKPDFHHSDAFAIRLVAAARRDANFTKDPSP